MVDNELDGVLVERIARVMFAPDLAAIAPGDIDAFLNSLEAEPFTEEQVERILGRIGLGGSPGGGPARPAAAERPGRFANRRPGRQKSQGYRLSCEELENRLPPSVYGAALAGPGLDFGMTLAAVPASATVRLWEGRAMMEVQGSADPWESGQAPSWGRSPYDATGASGGDAAAGVAWEALFCDMDGSCPVPCELQLAG